MNEIDIHTSHLLLYAIWIQLSQTVVSSANEIQIKVKSKVRFFVKPKKSIILYLIRITF